MNSFFKYRVLPALGLLASIGAAGYLLPSAMDRLQDLRQLERTPPSYIGAILGGETQTRGWVSATDTVLSTHTQTPSVYFAFRHEVERRDSEGNYHWEEEQYIERAVDFVLRDETGSVAIRAGEALRQIDWSIAQSYQVEQGRNRYTEWRLEPEQAAFVFGWAQADTTGMSLDFKTAGDYQPVISTFDAEHERQRFGSGVVYRLWGGLAAVAFVVFCGAVLLRIHRVWQYLMILTVLLTVVVTQLGLSLLRADLESGVARLEARSAQADKIFRLGFGDGRAMSEANQSLARVTLVASQKRLADQVARFPDNLLAKLWGISVPPAPFELNAEEQAELKQSKYASVETKLSGWQTNGLIVLGTLLTMGFTWWSFRNIKFKRLIENVPTQLSVGVVPGINEITGSVKLLAGDTALSGPLTGSSCTWYDYTVMEKVRSGKKTSWKVVEQDKQFLGFLCEDREGTLHIYPEHAEIITRHLVQKQEGRMRYIEKSLRVDDELYAIGNVDPLEDADRGIAMVGGDQDMGWPYILSNQSEREVMLMKGRLGLFFINLAFSSLVLAGLLLFASIGSFSPYDFLLTALVAPLYMLWMMIALHYNDLVFLKRRAERDYANIDVALRKRKNLIPRWESVAKGYIEHEKSLQKHLAKLRAANLKALEEPEFRDKYFKFEGAVLKQVQVQVEKYPDLKANKIVATMMDNISKLETEIAYLREGYNNSVTEYNARVETFPDLFLARSFRFAAMPRLDQR